jgi:hypothetical protein
VTGRRLLVLVIVLGVIGIPAAVLEAACIGRSCDNGEAVTARVPFCPLPGRLRTLLVNGYREGRSPDVLGVARSDPGVFTEPSSTSLREPWPMEAADDRVPIVFSGAGVVAGAQVPTGTTLDRIAPTVADIIGFERPFPKVRSGTPLKGVANGDRPTLVVLIAWKGFGTADVERAPASHPTLSGMLRDGAGTTAGSTGSLPLDPAATLTTIGTGGLPFQHGITGTYVRRDDGTVVRAFSHGEPIPVIATLADDLDAPASPAGPSPFDQRPVIALVETQVEDQGLIGGTWYEGHDVDHVDIAQGDDAVAAARQRLRGMGTDDVPDILGVVLDGGVKGLDRRTGEIVREAERVSGGSALVVVAGTGTTERRMVAESDTALVDAIEDAVPGSAHAVAATVPGGVFLDQAVLRDARITGQVAVDALTSVTSASGGTMMVDAFQGFAVSFARYC